MDSPLSLVWFSGGTKSAKYEPLWVWAHKQGKVSGRERLKEVPNDEAMQKTQGPRKQIFRSSLSWPELEIRPLKR